FLPVSLGGVLDMAAAVSDGLGDGAAAAFLAGSPPAVASPVDALRAGPVLVVHGAGDDRVPVTHAEAYAGANPDSELVVLADTGHSEFLDRSTPAWHSVAAILAA